MRTIEIGLEVHKAIEAERCLLDESENEILIRLLANANRTTSSMPVPPPSGKKTGAAWIKDGVQLPEGTMLRARYSGQTVHGEVIDGTWIVNGRSFASPSMALIHNVVTKDGRRTNINGWNHWDIKRPSDSNYIAISSLR